MIAGTPAMVMTLPIQKPGAAETLLVTRSAPFGTRAMRMRASFISVPRASKRAFITRDRSGSWSMPTPKALATLSAVMSSWVGPMPPVVNT